jgi:crotonobetainyl-CoA:carnitine CoA-transferase CaiB-like acyl-CoA transferase
MSGDAAALPLAGIRVVEFVHMVMGPTCGLVLADLGADVIKVEPAPQGDNTRRLVGSGAGFFATFNRNKRSLALDLRSAAGRDVARRLVATADVVTENFRPGAMDRLSLGWEQVRAINPRLVYCALKGYLPGPYEHLPALDEVVQMQGGLAYMTGPPGQPLRAGASVVDIMGGMFGVVAILAALRDRDRTGHGRLVRSALFESTAFLVSQHMASAALTGKPVPPMPARQASWSIYNVFETADGPVFLAVTSDAHWRRFCEEFALPDLLADAALATNDGRIAERARLFPRLCAELAKLSVREVMARCNRALVPVAPVNKPEDLFDDPHLRAEGGAMAEVMLSDTVKAFLPLLPISIEGAALGVRRQPPKPGEATREVLEGLGYSAAEIAGLAERGVIGGGGMA